MRRRRRCRNPFVNQVVSFELEAMLVEARNAESQSLRESGRFVLGFKTVQIHGRQGSGRNPFVNQVVSFGSKKDPNSEDALCRNPFVNQVVSFMANAIHMTEHEQSRNPFVNQVVSFLVGKCRQSRGPGPSRSQSLRESGRFVQWNEIMANKENYEWCRNPFVNQVVSFQTFWIAVCSGNPRSQSLRESGRFVP